MKEIAALENADRTKSFEEQNLNSTLYWAYERSKEAENENINFGDVIWDYDIAPMVEAMRAYGVTEFTISSTFSSLIPTLAEFEKLGCIMLGMTTVNARYTDFTTGKRAVIPAITMTL